MESYPVDISDFMEMFPTEDACLEYLSIVRWPDGYLCLRCGSQKYWKKARGLFVCCDCTYEASVTVGTLFQDTHKPLLFWFQAIWYVVNQKNGVSALGLKKALGFGSYHTAWEWLHKLRRAMVRPGRDRLSGLVEVDETFIGGVRSGKRGRGADGKSLILIAVEETPQGIGRIRLALLDNGTMQQERHLSRRFKVLSHRAVRFVQMDGVDIRTCRSMAMFTCLFFIKMP